MSLPGQVKLALDKYFQTRLLLTVSSLLKVAYVLIV